MRAYSVGGAVSPTAATLDGALRIADGHNACHCRGLRRADRVIFGPCEGVAHFGTNSGVGAVPSFELAFPAPLDMLTLLTFIQNATLPKHCLLNNLYP